MAGGSVSGEPFLVLLARFSEAHERARVYVCAFVCVSLLLTSGEWPPGRQHDPSLPAGIYWLALRPTAGRLVRSVLTTSTLQRHL